MVVLKVVEMVVVVVVDIEWLTSRGCGPECAVGHPSGGQTWNRWSEWSELDRNVAIVGFALQGCEAESKR